MTEKSQLPYLLLWHLRRLERFKLFSDSGSSLSVGTLIVGNGWMQIQPFGLCVAGRSIAWKGYSRLQGSEIVCSEKKVSEKSLPAARRTPGVRRLGWSVARQVRRLRRRPWVLVRSRSCGSLSRNRPSGSCGKMQCRVATCDDGFKTKNASQSLGQKYCICELVRDKT